MPAAAQPRAIAARRCPIKKLMRDGGRQGYCHLHSIAMQEATKMTDTENDKSDADRQQRVIRRRLTYAEYAAEKHISVDTVRRMANRGELQTERVSPKCVRIVEVTTTVKTRR